MMSCMEGSTKTSLTNDLNREGPSNYANSPTNIQEFENIPLATEPSRVAEKPPTASLLSSEKNNSGKIRGGGGGNWSNH